MTRPAPRITVPEIVARVRLNPSGAHQLELAVPGNVVSMILDSGQVEQLDAAIDDYRRRVAFVDGGPDLLHPRSVPLETRR